MNNNTWSPTTRVSNNGPILTVVLVTLVFFVIAGGIGMAFFVVSQQQSSAASRITPQQLYTRITTSPPTLFAPLTHSEALVWISSDYGKEDYCTSYSAQGLIISAPKPTSKAPVKSVYQGCLAAAVKPGNFAVQVKMTILRGNEGGLWFRCDPNTENYSFFNINQVGAFSVLSSTGSPLSTLLRHPDPAIKPGLGQPNIMTIIAQGHTFLFYANGHYLGQITNTHIPLTGYIGIFGYNAPGHESVRNLADVAFSDLRVWKL